MARDDASPPPATHDAGPFPFEGERALREGRLDEARAIFAALAEQGDPAGQLGLARLLLLEDPPRHEDALPLLEEAADNDDVGAMMMLGALHETTDPARALTRFEQAAERGASLGATRAGALHLDGASGEIRVDLAVRFFRLAIELEDEPEAWMRMGALAAVGVTDPRQRPDIVGAARSFIRGIAAAHALASRVEDPSATPYERWTAIGLRGLLQLEDELRALAIGGDVRAAYQLGVALDRNLLTRNPDDPGETGRLWIAAAADGREPMACFEVARRHFAGDRVFDDDARAYDLLQVAAEGGIAPAQAMLARALTRGDVRADDDVDAAARWYRAAAEHGHAGAMREFGLLLVEHMRRNDLRAGTEDEPATIDGVAWLRDAATRRDLDAMIELGALFEEGRVVDRDLIEATRWYLEARRRGDGRGLPRLWRYIDELSDEELLTAERRAGGNGSWTATYLRMSRYKDRAGDESATDTQPDEPATDERGQSDDTHDDE